MSPGVREIQSQCVHTRGDFLSLKCYFHFSMIYFLVFPCHSAPTATGLYLQVLTFSFFLSWSLIFCIFLESGNGNSPWLRILSPICHPSGSMCPWQDHTQSSWELHPGCSLCWESSCLDISLAHSITSFESLCKHYLLLITVLSAPDPPKLCFLFFSPEYLPSSRMLYTILIFNVYCQHVSSPRVEVLVFLSYIPRTVPGIQ